MAGELIPGMGSFNVVGVLGPVMYYVGIFFLAIIILGAFWTVLYMSKFTIKATVIPMYGSGKDGTFSFGKPKKNRIKWTNHRTAWQSMFPLLNKTEREPFDTEYIYPGNQIYVYELNDTWVPGRININQTEKEIRAEINPVPYYVRNWQSLTYRKHEIEFAKLDFWSENRSFFITLGVVAFCCILCGAVIYFTFEFAGGAKSSIDMLARAIDGVSNIANAPR